MKGTVIVELAAATTTLAALHPDDHPGWAGFLRRAHHQLATLTTRGTQLGGPHHPATTQVDADKRFPGAELDRWVRVRDRHCIGPFCTRPTHHAEIDHTRNWADHGLTVADNLAPPCPECHALKHLGRWDLTQPDPGRFCWHSPLGGHYRVDSRPVLEPARAPTPRADGRPRRVFGIPAPPRATDTGLRVRPPHPVDLDEIPTPPTHRHVTQDPDDDPPPF